MPYNGLTLLQDKKWDSFEIVCQTDSDCDMDQDRVQHCLDYYWDMLTEPQALQGSSYQQGQMCQSFETSVCPSEAFSAVNYNYNSTEFSYFSQYRCRDGSSSASALVAAGTAILTLLNFV